MTEIEKPMTPAKARQLNGRLCKLTSDYIAKAVPLLVEMRDRKGWAALGFENYEEYLSAEIRPLWQDAIGPNMVIKTLSDAGFSARSIAAAAGISKDTVARRQVSQNATPETSNEVIGADGKTYRRTAAKPNKSKSTDLDGEIDRLDQESKTSKPKKRPATKWTPESEANPKGRKSASEQLADETALVEAAFSKKPASAWTTLDAENDILQLVDRVTDELGNALAGMILYSAAKAVGGKSSEPQAIYEAISSLVMAGIDRVQIAGAAMDGAKAEEIQLLIDDLQIALTESKASQ